VLLTKEIAAGAFFAAGREKDARCSPEGQPRCRNWMCGAQHWVSALCLCEREARFGITASPRAASVVLSSALMGMPPLASD